MARPNSERIEESHRKDGTVAYSTRLMVGGERRYRAAAWALLTALLDERRGTHSDQWAVVRSINNARAACAARMRDEPLPEPTFPTTIDANRLTQIEPDGHDFSALQEWLGRHADPAEAS